MLTAKEFRKSSERVFLNDIIPILAPFEKERKATFQKLKKLWIIFIIAYAIYLPLVIKFFLAMSIKKADEVFFLLVIGPVVIVSCHVYSVSDVPKAFLWGHFWIGELGF